MKSIVERMTLLLTSELDETVLTEQMLMEAVDAADALLETNGLELKAEDLDSYIEGLQDILENYELSEEDRAVYNSKRRERHRLNPIKRRIEYIKRESILINKGIFSF